MPQQCDPRLGIYQDQVFLGLKDFDAKPLTTASARRLAIRGILQGRI
jgi:hypothetical protein